MSIVVENISDSLIRAIRATGCNRINPGATDAITGASIAHADLGARSRTRRVPEDLGPSPHAEREFPISQQGVSTLTVWKFCSVTFPGTAGNGVRKRLPGEDVAFGPPSMVAALVMVAVACKHNVSSLKPRCT